MRASEAPGAEYNAREVLTDTYYEGEKGGTQVQSTRLDPKEFCVFG